MASNESLSPVTSGHSAERSSIAIDVRSVSVVFERSRSQVAADDGRIGVTTALEDVSVSIRPGEFVAIVGATGCGKTTLLNLIAGLVRPTVGTVEVFGASPQSRATEIGYMWSRDALLPWRSAIGNVTFALEGRPGWPKPKRERRALALLQLVGLKGFEHSYRKELSQGMRQRVALARTLASDPTLLLMDEPFAALDAQTKLELQNRFLDVWERDIAEGRQRTLVFVTHDLQEAALLADRVIVMRPRPGRISVDSRVPLDRPRAGRLHEMLFADGFRDVYRELFNVVKHDLDM